MDEAPTAFHQRLAIALDLAQSEPREAVSMLNELVRQYPAQLSVRCAWVRALLSLGDIEAALAAATHPTLLDSCDVFATVLSEFAIVGASPARAMLLEAFVRRYPHDYAAVIALAASLHALDRPSAALRWSDYALVLRPGEYAPREIRAASLIDRGDIEMGLEAYRALLSGGDAQTAARYLVLMHYDTALENASLFAAQVDFARRHLPVSAPPLAERSRDPDKVLRVGWLSPRLSKGPVATFLGGMLAYFDRNRFWHLLIDLAPTDDADARHLRTLVAETLDASSLDDAQLLQQLRDLDLDVLVDLAGHSTANRVAVVAQRVAPVQVCWLDWFDTTGVGAMDAWISDEWLTPADSTQQFSECVVQLPCGRFCYTPPINSPLPSRQGDGSLVFASFNRLAKFNTKVIETWSDILRRLPEACLQLHARPLEEAETRAHIAARFAARGIDGTRLHLAGALPYDQLLAAYRNVDIALDPFPFSGCTTTCDALWMGCPVVTLPGESYVSRQSASLLWRLGRSEWIAHDHADYVERTMALAAQVKSLREQRAYLRALVRTRLCDAPAQARDFAAALRELWRRRCDH